MSSDVIQLLTAAGIITMPLSLLVYTIRMVLKGSLVSRQVHEDRMADRDKIIESKDERINEQAQYINTLEDQVELLSRGAKVTQQVVEALPRPAITPNRSGEIT